jgi:hypothetical protein
LSSTPTCDRGLTLNPAFLVKWTKLRELADSLRDRSLACAVIAMAIGYLLVGGYVHSIVLGIARRFLVSKWALLAALGVAAATVNAVGIARAVQALLKLPTHEKSGDPRHGAL